MYTNDANSLKPIVQGQQSSLGMSDILMLVHNVCSRVTVTLYLPQYFYSIQSQLVVATFSSEGIMSMPTYAYAIICTTIAAAILLV